MLRSVVLAWCFWWVALGALYLVLADSVVAPELVAGAVLAAVGATGAVLVRRERGRPIRPRLRRLRRVWRPLLGVFGDLAPLARVLCRRGHGSAYVEVPLPRAFASDDPAAQASRALSEAFGSLAPNTLVVEIDADRGVILAHQLEPNDRAASSAVPLSP